MPKTIKYGLKLWSDNQHYISEAEKLYRAGLYDYIELYIVPGTYEPHVETWHNLNIPFLIHCTHTIHGFNLAIKEKFENNLKIFAEVKAFCDALDGKFIIFHPGIMGYLGESIQQINSMNDKRLLVENKPYISMSGRTCRGSMYEELQRIIVSCNVGFCLDIAHVINAAFHLKIDYISYLEKMLTLSPQVVHISDGEIKTKHDRHLNIGHGEFDFKRISKIIALSNARHLTLETDRSGDALEDFVEDIMKMKGIMQNEYGSANKQK